MYPAASLPKLDLTGSLRAREAVSQAFVRAVPPAPRPADAFEARSASVTTLPRRSAAAAVEPVAPTAWGRALQVMRSWFQPAATAALLGAGLVPSLIGSTGPVQAVPAPDLTEAVAQDATRVSVAAPAVRATGDRDAAVDTARDMLFGTPDALVRADDDGAVRARAWSDLTGGVRLGVPSRAGGLDASPRAAAPDAAPRTDVLGGGLRLGSDPFDLGLFGRSSSTLGPTRLADMFGSRAVEARPAAPRTGVAELSSTRTSLATPSLDALGRLPAASWSPDVQPRLDRGSRGPAVVRLQDRLSTLGYDAGTSDGAFGRRTRTAVLEYQFDHRAHGRVDGRVSTATWRTLAEAQARRAAEPTRTPGGLTIRSTYTPFSRDAIRLFEEAADRVDLPRSWASSPGLHRLLTRESHGEVGKLNYTYGGRSERDVHAELRAGIRSSRSSATGLGQLLLGNVDRYYPSGRAGIGDPVEEAAGMLRYIDARYGSPSAAWASYGRHHEGY